MIGVASVAGRLVIGAVADRFGRVRTFQACFALLAASFLIWFLATSWPGFVAFAVVLGTGYGGWIALQPTVLAQMFGVRGLGALVGLVYTAAGVGALAGPPLAGVVVDATGGFGWAVAGAGLFGVGAFLALLALPAGARPDGRPATAPADGPGPRRPRPRQGAPVGAPSSAMSMPPIRPQNLRVLEGRFVLARVTDVRDVVVDAGLLALVLGPDGGATMRRDDAAGDAWAALWNGDDAHDPEATGMLGAIVAPLAAGGLPVWTAASYDGDLVLVPAGRYDEAVDVLRRAGHHVST